MDTLGTAITKALASVSRVTPPSCAPDALAKRYDASNLPAWLNRQTDLEIPRKVWSAWIPRDGSRSIIRALSDDERQALTARAAELRPALASYARPAEDDRVAEVLFDMFGGFRSMREQGADAVGRVDSAMRALALFPAWAIEHGCLSIQRDGYEVADRDGVRIERHWPPSDPEICKIVAKIEKHHRAALVTAEALLSAPIEEPAPMRDQSRRDAQVEEVRESLGTPGRRQPVLPPSADLPIDAPVPPPPDGKHAQRVMAELAARRAQREAQENAA